MRRRQSQRDRRLLESPLTIGYVKSLQFSFCRETKCNYPGPPGKWQLYQPSIGVCVCLCRLRTGVSKGILKAIYFHLQPDASKPSIFSSSHHMASACSGELTSEQGSSFHRWTTQTVRKGFPMSCGLSVFSTFLSQCSPLE